MRISPRKKKWLKRLAIFLLIGVIVGGLLHEVIVYRFKEFLQVTVKRESNGRYSFDAEDIDVGLLGKNIRLQKIWLRCIDTSKDLSQYDVKIPEVYLSIESFTDFIFHEKLSIDSMSVLRPELSVQVKEKEQKAEISFEASKFMDVLQKAVLHLQVRTFKITDASFTIYNDQFAQPFKGSNVNLEVSKFSKKDKVKNYLFSADDVDLLVTNQRWQMPDGLHELSFRRLHFSGKNQLFELDTCNFISRGGKYEHSINLQADRIFFNSRRLQDIYQKEELSIDTISFLRPILTLRSAAEKNLDSSALTAAMSSLMKKISFKYIDIKDGEFSFGEKSGLKTNYQTQKTNLQLYNLSIHPGQKKSLTLDSINLSLTNLVFYTRDSLHQLTIGEFALNKDHLSLRNTAYGPTVININPNSLRFSTKLLDLEKVSLEELIKKRLVGTVARLNHPQINVIGGRNADGLADTERGMKDFFKTLTTLRDLIEVDSFRIVDGELNYKSLKYNLSAKLQGLNSTMLINQLLRSDSLVDVKRSLPDFSVASVNIKNRKLNLQVNNYRFEGLLRNSKADAFRLNAAGMALYGRGISWHRFNWDVYVKDKLIDISRIDVDELTAGIVRSKKAVPDETKDIPAISIGQFTMGKLNFDLETMRGGRLKISGKDIFVDDLRSEDEYLRWNHVMGQFKDLSYLTKTVQASADAITLDNQKENSAYNTRIVSANGNMLLEIPAMHLVTDFLSTDISNPGIRSLVLDKPMVILKSRQAKTTEVEAFEVPLDLEGELVEVRSGQVHYFNEEDSAKLSAVVNLKLRNFSARQELETIRTSGADLNVEKTIFQKPGLTTGIDSAKIRISNLEIFGNDQLQPQFLAGIDASWWGGNAKFEIHDSSMVTVKSLDGRFNRDFMEFNKGDKFDWKDLMKDAKLFKGSGKYESDHFHAEAGLLAWNGAAESLHAENFSVLPLLSMEEAFKKSTWQSDYMTVKGRSLDVNGISLNTDTRDTVLHVNKVLLDNIEITTARDKRLPLKHGIEKLMPTRLINSISYPFEIDSVILLDSKVEVHEFSSVTNQHGIIPLENVSAVITNIKSASPEPVDPNATAISDDSLRVVASAKLLGNYIDKLRYSESYSDSLSYFTLHFHASPMIFSSFTKATRPLASIIVKGGNSDTLYADWVGNKYAAIGKMNFVYRGLSVRLLDKKNPGRKSFVLDVVNFLVNRVLLRRKNHREAIVFFERDKEKFVFNYWVKTSLNGLLSSVGLKKNKKIMREFERKEAGFGLPDADR